MSRYYKLNESGEPVAVTSVLEWGKAFERQDRTVKRETINGCEVSTVFLGLDHSYTVPGPPILWETMVFGPKLSDYQERCSGGRADALAMHERVVEMLKALTP